MPRHVLVTGASIAGPALAYWLARYGVDVTVVERAPEFRDGGQSIDVRGAGRTVAERMGLIDAIRERTTHEDGLAFVDADGEVDVQVEAGAFGGNGPVAELEILRGELARTLIEHSRTTGPTGGRVRYVFGDRIAGLDDTGDAVEVDFESGDRQSFRLVLVAEGVGSSTRALVFSDEVERVPLDLYVAYFTIPKGPTDGRISRWFNAPGGRSVLLRPDNLGTTQAVLSLQTAPVGYEDLSADRQKAVLREAFADAGWETPRVLDGMDAAPDFYFEATGQVRMPRWSKGRVAVVGDAAYCASPISGMGTSLALVGAYVLAGELAHHDDHRAAFEAYERTMRPYVEQAQDVPSFGVRVAQPQTEVGIALQRIALKVGTSPLLRPVLAKVLTPPSAEIDLPDYSAAEDRLADSGPAA